MRIQSRFAAVSTETPGRSWSLLGEALCERDHPRGPVSVRALDGAADRVGVEIGHRDERAEHVAVGREHVGRAAEPVPHRLARVGMGDRLHDAVEAAAVEEVASDGVEEPVP